LAYIIFNIKGKEIDHRIGILRTGCIRRGKKECYGGIGTYPTGHTLISVCRLAGNHCDFAEAGVQ
jgi:hypothetical protein